MKQKKLSSRHALEKLLLDKTDFEKRKPDVLATIARHQSQLVAQLTELEKNPHEFKRQITYKKDLLCGLQMASDDIHAQGPWFAAKEQELRNTLSTSEYAFFTFKKTIKEAFAYLPFQRRELG